MDTDPRIDSDSTTNRLMTTPEPQTKTERSHREKREFKPGFALGHTNPMVRC